MDNRLFTIITMFIMWLGLVLAAIKEQSPLLPLIMVEFGGFFIVLFYWLYSLEEDN